MKKEGVQTRKRKPRNPDGVPSRSRRSNHHNSSHHRISQQAAQVANIEMSNQIQHNYVHVSANGNNFFCEFSIVNTMFSDSQQYQQVYSLANPIQQSMAEQQQLINIAIQPSLVDPGVFIPQHHQMLSQQGFTQVEYHGGVSEASGSQNCIQEGQQQPTMEELAMMQSHRE
jgi:hypothetical protein